MELDLNSEFKTRGFGDCFDFFLLFELLEKRSGGLLCTRFPVTLRPYCCCCMMLLRMYHMYTAFVHPFQLQLA